LIYIPLIFVVGISMIKDLLEDLKRHASDKEENNKPVFIFQNGDFVLKRWKDI